MTTAVEIQTMKVFDADILGACRQLDRLVYADQFIKDIELETAIIKLTRAAGSLCGTTVV